MRIRSFALAATAMLLGAPVARLSAQAVVPFDLNNVTIAFYEGNGTAINTAVAYDYSASTQGTPGSISSVTFNAGPGIGSNPWDFPTEIDFSQSSGLTAVYVSILLPDNVESLGRPFKNYDKIVISGLFPVDPAYELSGIATTQPGDFNLGLITVNPNEMPFYFDGHNGTWTIEQLNDISLNTLNIWVQGELSAVAVSAVPEPAAAASVLAIGAVAWAMWRRRRETKSAKTG